MVDLGYPANAGILHHPASSVTQPCPECGAAVPAGGSCRDHFHQLLWLEWQIPGGPGELAHFLAVATYGLQHPAGMNYTAGTVQGLRRAVADVLDGRTTIAELRPRIRAEAKAAGRVTRREGDAEVRWEIATWPLTVVDVLSTPPDARQYGERVAAWARSVMDTLGRHGPPA